MTTESEFREVRESVARIEKKIFDLDAGLTAVAADILAGRDTYRQLNETMRAIQAVIEGRLDVMTEHAAGIVPGGLIPIRSAFLMVLITLGGANAANIGRYLEQLINAMMGVH